MKIYLIVIILFTLGGCSSTSKYVVEFNSNPEGASLICSGKNWGPTPIELYYDESVKKQSFINASGCSANWVSGARKIYPSNLVIYPSGGTTITLDRPRGDGYAQDARYALQLRQTEAAERSASEAQKQNNKAITCYTNYGVTTCY